MYLKDKIHKVIIFGIGQIAEVAQFYLTYDSPYKVVAFTVDKEYMQRDKLFNLPIISFENIKDEYSPDEFTMFAPIS